MVAGRLEALQRRFVRTVTFLADAEFAAGVTGGGRLTAEEAVAVYRKGYPSRLTEALGETYEACWRVLGDEEFLAAAAAYVARTPSRSHNLSDYGEGFAEFLESRPSAASAPFIGDLARFEWTFKDLFHAKPHAGLTPAVLAAKARPDAVLRLGGAVRLLSLRHRVHGIWRRDRADDTPLQPGDWDGAERLVLYKNGGNPVFVRELSAPGHAALSGLARGLPLQDALAAADGLDAEGARSLFSFLAESGLVAEAA
jgi:hypothetical protein